MSTVTTGTELPFRIGGPGRARHHVARAIAAGRFRRVLRGVYVDSEVPDDLGTRARAVALVTPPGSAVSRLSAAWVWGLDVAPPGVSPADRPVDVAVPPDRTPPRTPGVLPHHAALRPTDLTSCDGILLTTPARTAADCARALPRIFAVACLDLFRRHRGVTLWELQQQAVNLPGHRWARHLRECIDLSDPRSESPGESWSRVRVADWELPVPTPQVEVRDAAGGTRRLDLADEERRLALEYDGQEHHTSPTDREHDRRRRQALVEAGWLLVVARREDVLGPSRPLAAAWAEALVSRGWTPDPGTAERIAKDRPVPRREPRSPRHPLP